ncbi:uncharacterized protein [Miscanthus floridulus]|uniref:uncharacterized protein n=1 Tax=Miscanthus floridulus TaxID=154761 RepID=UPI003457B3DF
MRFQDPLSNNRLQRTRNVLLLNCILELCQQEPLRRDPERVLTASASTPAMAAPQSSTDSLVPPLRRLVFDRRYGWIFDEWTDPADQALSGGRGMFCAVTTARSLVNAGASSINYADSSISRVLQHPKRLPLPAYMSSLAFRKKQQAWFRELECSGVVADLKLIHCCTHSVLECTATDCLCLTKKHGHL